MKKKFSSSEPKKLLLTLPVPLTSPICLVIGSILAPLSLVRFFASSCLLPNYTAWVGRIRTRHLEGVGWLAKSVTPPPPPPEGTSEMEFTKFDVTGDTRIFFLLKGHSLIGPLHEHFTYSMDILKINYSNIKNIEKV
jgi:hypothetical protein